MRIISGTHKGRRLEAPKKLPVRPTTDRSKEGLFNILQHKYDLKNTSVLDLFLVQEVSVMSLVHVE